MAAIAAFAAVTLGSISGHVHAQDAATQASAPAPMQQVSIAFAAKAHGAAVACGKPIDGLGTTAVTAELRDLRFYVSNVELIDEAGRAAALRLAPGEWQTPEVALIDLADDAGACAQGSTGTNTQVTGQVPQGNYRSLRFTVGVPQAQNHSSVAAAPQPLDVQAMAWSWQAGRKFLQVEINPAGGVARAKGNAAPGRSFLLHLGSTGCKGNPMTGETVACQRPNRMEVRIDGFDPLRQRVVLDLAALYAGSDLRQDQGGALGCMSSTTDAECAPIFHALGIDLQTGQAAATAQTIFHGEAR
ncbi:hypothetical protein SDC9_146485 [bioreactor metagenome]|uniref:Copper-binding protein MbnP-like domain-containing protein n=1 Tax=bioreactor metagenome TaxID=1076179 RepID=A0A645EB67_9ZZZZ